MPAPSENLANWSPCEIFGGFRVVVMDVGPTYGYDNPAVLDMVLAQSALETNKWTSGLLLRTDNFFGMRIANQRPQPIIGEDNGYAVYAYVLDSVHDYFHRQRAFGVPNNPANYIAATIASGYATASHYAEAWQSLYQAAAENVNAAYNLGECDWGQPATASAGSGGLGLLLLLLLGYKLLEK